MWYAAYSDLTENVNEGLFVPPADDISLEILPEPYSIISQLPKNLYDNAPH